MIESNVELSQLKQEVAELWSRYRREEPRQGDDPVRRTLADQNRALEAKRRVLSERSAMLRTELEHHRRRLSRLSPVVRVFGGLVGSIVAAALLWLVLPEIAAASVDLSVAQGAGLLTSSLLLVAIAVMRTAR